ncbi:hypothetical protein NVS47_16195 [Dehalobacterium formicoaceticum]|uniref:Uncharacterized protein n=1 Tax=Dehalobacterium formicoaceticum TaxID=51515 RepID=A0ABT1YBI9_9FIRM|nr:DUF6618 family protein [Dehalobacterium formicoaceticum]MCR6547031.1 hypothetical protein [Dehalobacterium formicoaceticum]
MSKQPFSPVRFECHQKIGKHFEHWSGAITRFINHGSHYEIYISSRSGFVFIVGEYLNGAFISIPAFNVGSDLADYGDYFWNNERLASIMNPVDAATIAEALRTLNSNKFI